MDNIEQERQAFEAWFKVPDRLPLEYPTSGDAPTAFSAGWQAAINSRPAVQADAIEVCRECDIAGCKHIRAKQPTKCVICQSNGLWRNPLGFKCICQTGLAALPPKADKPSDALKVAMDALQKIKTLTPTFSVPNDIAKYALSQIQQQGTK